MTLLGTLSTVSNSKKESVQFDMTDSDLIILELIQKLDLFRRKSIYCFPSQIYAYFVIKLEFLDKLHFPPVEMGYFTILQGGVYRVAGQGLGY